MSERIERRLSQSADMVDEREAAWREILAEEKEIQRRKIAAFEALNEAREVQKSDVHDALTAGIARSRIALLARLSRVTVNKYIDEKGNNP